jgi:hypothetical protein
LFFGLFLEAWIIFCVGVCDFFFLFFCSLATIRYELSKAIPNKPVGGLGKLRFTIAFTFHIF